MAVERGNIDAIIEQLNSDMPPQRVLNTTKDDNYQIWFYGDVNLGLFVKSVETPGKSLGTAVYKNPFTEEKKGGDITYSDLSVTFYVNADYSNYMALDAWMDRIGVPHGQPYDELKDPDTDAILALLDNKKNPVRYQVFRNVRPINLSGLSFGNAGDDIYLTATVTLSVSSYYFMEV